VIFLVSGDHKLAAVSIFNHANSGEYGHAAAKSVAILVLAGSAMMLIWIYERRATRPRRTISAQPAVAAAPLLRTSSP
jgi:iron(III) transport system permease protein